MTATIMDEASGVIAAASRVTAQEAIVASGIPEIVEPRRVTPPPYGLLVSAPVVNRGDVHWEQGLTWEEEPGVDILADQGAVGAFDSCGIPDLSPDGSTISTGKFTPFAVWVAERCTAQYPQDVLEARALRSLNRLQGALIEKEFWTGAAAVAATPDLDNQWLTKSPVALNSSAATMPVEALARLEAQIALSITGPAMIHCTPQTATFWYHHQLLRREGRLLLTALDTVVVPGAGYPGQKADNTPSTTIATAWAYATPLVTVYLGTPWVIPPHVTDTNIRTHIVSRMVGITSDLLDGEVPIGILVSHCSANQSCPA